MKKLLFIFGLMVLSTSLLAQNKGKETAATTVGQQGMAANNSYNSCKSNSAGLAIAGVEVFAETPQGKVINLGKTDKNGFVSNQLDKGIYMVYLGDENLKGRITFHNEKVTCFSFQATPKSDRRRPELMIKNTGVVTISVTDPGVK